MYLSAPMPLLKMNTPCSPSQLRYTSASQKPSHALPSGKQPSASRLPQVTTFPSLTL